MAEYKLRLPSMGEGVMEATVTEWLIEPGSSVEEDESVVEVATDKVDSDIPLPVEGKLVQIVAEPNTVVKVGEVLGIFEVDELPEDAPIETPESTVEPTAQESSASAPSDEVLQEVNEFVTKGQTTTGSTLSPQTSTGFLSPLVRAICEAENITEDELNNIQGTGAHGRITKADVHGYLKNRSNAKPAPQQKPQTQISQTNAETPAKPTAVGKGEEIIEMDRMRKLISMHMLESKRTSAHVSSFVEADVTNIVQWREKIKNRFLKEEGEKFTYMPLFVKAIVNAIQKYPMINVSVEGDTIIKKPYINVGIAAALPSGNLIVPVIKNANELSLRGLAKRINDLAERARTNNLKPDEIQGGTYTLTNIGSFGNITGTPIINQPQVAIMAVGAIVKKPAVIETPQGDLIGIRHKMYLSHTYDHRVVDGALGGMFVKEVANWLENFSPDTEL